MRSVALSAAGWALALLLSSWAAKVAAVLFRLSDGGGQGLWTPLAPFALLHDDLQLAVPFGLLAWGCLRLGIGSRGRARITNGVVAGCYGLLVFWLMFNIPVVRLMSSPVTRGFLHAVGGALGDSFARYATFTNLGIPLGLWLAALFLPARLARLGWPRTRRARITALVAAAVLGATGPFAATRMEAAGLGGNAVVVFAKSVMAGAVPRSSDPLPDLDAPACAASADPSIAAAAPRADLSDLLGFASGRNVLWVILESTGARALPAYGALLDVTPHLSALAKEALVFDHAYAAYPESIKGLFSMLCARPPPARAEASEYGAAAVRCAAIAAELTRAGYRTGLFHSSWFAYLGMNAVVQGRGFEHLVDAAQIESPHRSSFGVDDRATAQRVLNFVDGLAPGQRFFAVYMPIAGHHPYHTPGQGVRPLPERGERDEYLNDLLVGDVALGELRAGLRARRLDDRTLYVVVGDHGEAFREHDGNVAHALYLYEENVHVPFLVAAPGFFVGQRRAGQLVSLVDLAPTTLALLGLPRPPEYPDPAPFRTVPRTVRFFTEQATRRAGLRDGRFKFILNQDNGRAELFDLAADPGERQNLADAHPDLVARYRGCLEPR